jgi:hypothetical protein
MLRSKRVWQLEAYPWSGYLLFGLLSFGLIVSCLFLLRSAIAMTSAPTLLTDPFLQLPTENSVRVVWLTEFAGQQHRVFYGEEFGQQAIAQTSLLSRTREDQNSNILNAPNASTRRLIWRHEAEVGPIPRDVPIPYYVTSVRDDGATVSSAAFTLAANPTGDRPLKILLTSDHQLKPLVAANLQKVVETVGQVDLVLFAGDLVNVPDRASEWFDAHQGNGFFPTLQGRAQYDLAKNGRTTRYSGGAILQSAPMFTAIGNHEVMGRFASPLNLDQQFNDPVPRSVAQARYQATVASPTQTAQPKAATPQSEADWVKEHSFNTDTYEELFTLPTSPSGGRRYYATTFGNLRLIVLYATNIWRSPSLAADTRGKYRERQQDLANPDAWGWGQFLFESIAPDSPQYAWLTQELASPEFQQATYKVIMLHHPPHTLGENAIPAYTDPVQILEKDAQGTTIGIRYEYPQHHDYITRDLMPLLDRAGVQLVFYGHSHLWNRFHRPSGIHCLETSNVGNSYGGYWGDRANAKRHTPEGYHERYLAQGDPNGLSPIVPTIAPLLDADGTPQPYISSNDITVFSIFDTGSGTISSYRFDTREPDSPVVLFDRFSLNMR